MGPYEQEGFERKIVRFAVVHALINCGKFAYMVQPVEPNIIRTGGRVVLQFMPTTVQPLALASDQVDFAKF